MGIKKKTYVNLRGFSVPLSRSPFGQRIGIVKEEHSFLQGLDLADKGKGDSNIDVLIGADYYWDIVEGEIKRENNERLIALKSKLGWLLSGPLTTTRPVEVSVNLAMTHVLKVSSVYKKCIDKIESINNRYEVNLPLKNENPILEDNCNLCLKRLKNLKNKLGSNKRLLVDYDNIIKNS